MLRWLLLLSISISAPEVYGQTPLPRIQVSGNEFVDDEGKIIVFRGYSSSDPDKLEAQGSWNKRYFEELKAWGANIVRFPVHPEAWRRRGTDTYLELLDQGIRWAGELGMYVIIDWHSIGNLKSQIFYAEWYDTSQKETFHFWKTMSERYGKDPVVAFYELFNEPTTFNQRLGTITWSDWKVLMEEMITIVRANGGEGIPLVAGFNWAYDLTPVQSDPIAAEGIAYVSHPYPQKRDAPWEEKWTADWGFVKEHYPLILTEMGFCPADDPGAHVPVIGDETYGEAITSYCDTRNISYIVWVFDMHWDPSLYTDDHFTPSRAGKYFKEKLNRY